MQVVSRGTIHAAVERIQVTPACLLNCSMWNNHQLWHTRLCRSADRGGRVLQFRFGGSKPSQLKWGDSFHVEHKQLAFVILARGNVARRERKNTTTLQGTAKRWAILIVNTAIRYDCRAIRTAA